MRLLEVNGTNMIGVTRREAIDAFRRAGHVLRLLVCEGWSELRNETISMNPEETSSVMSNGSSVDDRPLSSISYRPRVNLITISSLFQTIVDFIYVYFQVEYGC